MASSSHQSFEHDLKSFLLRIDSSAAILALHHLRTCSQFVDQKCATSGPMTKAIHFLSWWMISAWTVSEPTRVLHGGVAHLPAAGKIKHWDPFSMAYWKCDFLDYLNCFETPISFFCVGWAFQLSSCCWKRIWMIDASSLGLLEICNHCSSRTYCYLFGGFAGTSSNWPVAVVLCTAHLQRLVQNYWQFNWSPTSSFDISSSQFESNLSAS